jgi:hypothetical protein
MKDQDLTVMLGILGSMMMFGSRDQGSTGQSDYYKTLLWLLGLKSVKKIVLISSSEKDLKRNRQHVIDIDPEKKIILATDIGYKPPVDPKERFDKPEHFQTVMNSCNQIINGLQSNNIEIDLGFFFMSQGSNSSVCIPHYLPKLRDPNQITIPRAMNVRYTAPLCTFLSLYKQFPYFVICTDPRHFRHQIYPREVCNPPVRFLSQANGKHIWKRITQFGPPPVQAIENWESTYDGVEKIDLIDVQLDNDFRREKSIKFSVISAQLDSDTLPPEEDYRYMQLKKWVLDPDINRENAIYGYWHSSRVQGDQRFKGFVPSTEDLYNIMRNTRYTVIMPTNYGWATSKPWIVASRGTIPFIPDTYDVQQNQPLPRYLRVSSPQEMYQKIDELEANPEKRYKLLEELYNEMSDGPQGVFMTNVVNNYLSASKWKIKI